MTYAPLHIYDRYHMCGGPLEKHQFPSKGKRFSAPMARSLELPSEVAPKASPQSCLPIVCILPREHRPQAETDAEPQPDSQPPSLPNDAETVQ